MAAGAPSAAADNQDQMAATNGFGQPKPNEVRPDPLANQMQFQTPPPLQHSNTRHLNDPVESSMSPDE